MSRSSLFTYATDVGTLAGTDDEVFDFVVQDIADKYLVGGYRCGQTLFVSVAANKTKARRLADRIGHRSGAGADTVLTGS